ASSRVKHAGRRRDLRFNSVQNRLHVLKNDLGGVVAEQIRSTVRIWTDNSDRFHVLFKRKNIILILEKHDSFASSVQGYLLVFLRMNELLRVSRVNIRVLE